MSIVRVFAGIAVADLDAAAEWYARLSGRPADERPMPRLAEWHIGATGGVQVFGDAAHAGGTVATITVGDLDGFVAGLAGRGIAVDPPTAGDKARFVAIPNPEGNTITIAEAS